jgi:hypothetical protein
MCYHIIIPLQSTTQPERCWLWMLIMLIVVVDRVDCGVDNFAHSVVTMRGIAINILSVFFRRRSVKRLPSMLKQNCLISRSATTYKWGSGTQCSCLLKLWPVLWWDIVMGGGPAVQQDPPPPLCSFTIKESTSPLHCFVGAHCSFIIWQTKQWY